ncbi:MAG TPA: SDR family oxidoreductase [Acidimicrobiales bacterium]|nr:SDR family oxidoreductase [Acidimicrobiales bacterium]
MTAPAGRRTALVTGGSSGMGLAVAEFLAEEGYSLTICGRDVSRLRDARSHLEEAGAEVAEVSADLSEEGAAERVVEAHLSRYGGLDVVMAGAGFSRRATVAETHADSLRRLLTVHVESSFALARAALPALRRPPSGRPGWFIVMSSISASWPVAGFAGYSAAKAALLSLARSINAEEGDQGVRACAICPAFVDTPLTAPLRGSVNREDMLSPDDVVAAVRFLLSLSRSASVGQLVIERVGAGTLSP